MSIPLHPFRLSALLTAFLALLPSIAQAQAPEEFKLTASDGTEGDGFGAEVSISGDVALIGAPGNELGSAYVFRWDGSQWNEEQKLTASNSADEIFGHSVAISGDVALVGARFDNGDYNYTGSAYVFRWDGTQWNEEQRITPSDSAADDGFGASVSLSGNVALVGAPPYDPTGDGGNAYIFRWDGTQWNEEQKLTHGFSGIWAFGFPVSISGDIALVSAAYEASDVFVFRWDGTTWNQERVLGIGEEYVGFGSSISVSDDVILVGAPLSERGSVYVVRWDGTRWNGTQRLTASDAAAGDRFGRSVSVSGDVALVGASGNELGSVYVFRWDGSQWNETQKITASDGAAIQFFGTSVSLSGNVALVGAVGGGDVSGSGSAYAYPLPQPPVSNETTPTDGFALTVAPNPFATATTLTLRVATQQTVRVEAFDVLGRRVAVLHDGPVPPDAPLRLTFDAATLPAGLYVVRATGETVRATRRITLSR